MLILQWLLVAAMGLSTPLWFKLVIQAPQPDSTPDDGLLMWKINAGLQSFGCFILSAVGVIGTVLWIPFRRGERWAGWTVFCGLITLQAGYALISSVSVFLSGRFTLMLNAGFAAVRLLAMVHTFLDWRASAAASK